MRLIRLLVLAGVLLLAAVTAAASPASAGEFTGHHRQVIEVVAVRGLTLGDLPQLARRGAVGLLVPSAGPRTSAALAFAGIVRGVLHNARLGRRPDGPVLIRVRTVDRLALAGERAIVLGLPPDRAASNDRRYPMAVLGACRGVLSSSLTRVPGLVSAADIARTALRSPHALRCRPDADAAASLRRLEQRIEVARSSTMAATVIVLSLLLGFALLLPGGTLPALAAALAANLGLGLFPGGGVAGRLTLFSLCVVAGGVLWRRARPAAATGTALLAVLAAYAVAMAVRPDVLSLAPLGPELTARFYGVSNGLETLLLVPALAGATLLARRFGTPAFTLVAVLGLATVAENRLGADGGGAVVLGTAFAVLAVGLARARLRMVVPALAIAALAVLVLVNVDAAATGPDHLSGALGGGLAGLATALAHRVPLAYARVSEQWYFVFPLGALAWLALRTRAWPAPRESRVLVAAFAAAIAASLLVNDSPGPVTLAALASFLALEPLAVRRELGLAAARLLAQQPATPAVVPEQQ